MCVRVNVRACASVCECECVRECVWVREEVEVVLQDNGLHRI